MTDTGLEGDGDDRFAQDRPVTRSQDGPGHELAVDQDAVGRVLVDDGDDVGDLDPGVALGHHRVAQTHRALTITTDERGPGGEGE